MIKKTKTKLLINFCLENTFLFGVKLSDYHNHKLCLGHLPLLISIKYDKVWHAKT